MPTLKQRLMVGEWLPDLPQNENPGVNTATNVLPLTKQSYSPCPSFQRGATSALPSTPLGAFAAKDASGNPAVYAGTSSNLYAITNATKPNFSNVSSTPGVYSVAVGDAWSFEAFDTKVYASNGTDPIQSAPIADAATKFSTVDANAPKAKVVVAIQPGFLLCGNINDPTVGIQTQGVRWSALGSAGSGSWPLIGSTAAITVQSDWQAIRGGHGALQAITNNVPVANALLYFERAVFRMSYTGDAAIFDIQPVEKARGTPARRSVVQLGQLNYYLGYDGFYVNDGTESYPIGRQKVDQFYFNTVDPNYLNAIQGCADPLNGLVYWAFPGFGNNNGIPNFILVYNTIIQRWSLITAFAGSNPIIGLSFGTSLDGIDALGYNLDNLPFSLDSPILAGGAQYLAAFDASNYFGYFTGVNLPFQVETTEANLTPGRSSKVLGVHPLVEGDNVTIAVGARDTINVASSYGPDTSVNNAGTIPARSSGRYHRLMLKGASGNTVTHIKGGQVEFSGGGNR